MNNDLKWKLAFAFLLVFIAGIMTGGLFSAYHIHRLFLGPPHSGSVAERMRNHLRRELRLTSEQETKIFPIVDATSAKLEAIRIETAQRVRNAMEESHREIAPQLTPEQQKKLDAMKEEHRRRLMHHGFPLLESSPP